MSSAAAIYFCGAYSGGKSGAGLLKANAAVPATPGNSAPFFDLSNERLVNIRADDLSIGTSLYPWRKPHRPDLLFSECREIGFNCVRLAYERNHCQKLLSAQGVEQYKYQLPNPDISNLIHSSGLDVIMLIQGHAGDNKGNGIEWIRLEDGTIDGKANAASLEAYTRWLLQHTREFVQVYELWNEAFGHIDDQQFKKSFGPGGSLENADNYAAMMLPSMNAIRRIAPEAKVTIEGNYWNVEKSVAQSSLYQTLLAHSDYVVKHPYGYDPGMYSGGAEGHASQLYEQDRFYRSINPEIKWIYTEYAPTAKVLGVKENELNGELQAKAVLRTTLLHLRHGIKKLCLFDLYYPTALEHTLMDQDGTRRPAWYVLQQFLKSCALQQASVNQHLLRSNKIEADLRDLSIATTNGFLYCVWQETEPQQFIDRVNAKNVTVQLHASGGRPLHLSSAVDPLNGKDLRAECIQKQDGGGLSLTLPCKDYPLLCKLVLG